MKYTARYEREADGRWTVEVPEVKGCHTYGRTIDQARERIREALGLFVDDADTAEIVDEVRLPADVRKQVQYVYTVRKRLTDTEQEIATAQYEAVLKLRGMKLGHRDVASLLSLSHQRVHQIERKELEDAPGALIERGRAPRSHHVVRRAAKKR